MSTSKEKSKTFQTDLSGKILFLGIFLFSPSLLAYAELARHGYTNCTACHLSPGGGGLLTSYGRELSKEILSTWGAKGEQAFTYGKISTDENVLLGAFVRGLQMREEDRNHVEDRAILMQADAEAAYNAPKWAVDLALGRQEVREGSESKGRFFSRRHYLLYRASELFSVRAGRFLHFFGLNDPNHNLAVRRDLNFGFDTETNNLELSYLGDPWSAYLTYVDGASTDEEDSHLRDRAGSLSVSYFFQEKNKVGLSLYNGEDDLAKRKIAGAWFIYAFHPHFFLLSEFDHQERENKTSDITHRGYVTSHRLSYEVIQGVIPFVSYDKSFLDSDNSNTSRQTYGAGLQFFPRPHFEFVGSWQKEENPSADLLWLMLHFYL